jgi:sortase A
LKTGSRAGAVHRIAEIVAWTVGVVLLVFYGATRARQTAAAKREVREFTRVREQARTLSWGSPDQSLWSPERIRAWQQLSTGAATAAIAVLKVPRVGLEVPVFEGTSDADLDRGAGHIEGTPGPDAVGNVGIAGHRDGFFRVLKDVSVGDAVEMETRTRTFRYVVDSLTLVGPDDTWVLDDTPTREISLVTCFPFYYQGSAPQRYIVRAVERGTAP